MTRHLTLLLVLGCSAPRAPVAAPRSPQAVDDAPRQTATFARGVNVNHWIGDNLPESMLPNATYGAAWFDEEDVRWIAAQGFDHVRVWVAGDRWTGTDGGLDEQALAPFDRLLAWARDARLGVVLAMHGTPRFRVGLRGDPPPPDASSPFTDESARRDAARLWGHVARRYAHEGDALRFELIVRPDAADAPSMQAFNREALAAVRQVDTTRVVYLTAHEGADAPALEVDLSDPRTALSVSFWEPEAFTYQIDPSAPLVAFPGTLDEALIPAGVARLADASQRGRVYVSEFGVARRADDASSLRYLRAVRSAFDRHGVDWAVYDYHTAFAVRDREGAATRVVEGLGLGAG